MLAMATVYDRLMIGIIMSKFLTVAEGITNREKSCVKRYSSPSCRVKKLRIISRREILCGLCYCCIVGTGI